MNANDITNALKTRHPRDAWIFASEVNTSTGYDAPHQDGPGGIRRIDAFALALWPSKKFKRVAYEIKVSRQDWLNEIKNPVKRAQAWYLAHEFWFAVAEGVVSPGDWKRDMIGCGLLIIREDGSIEISTKARYRPECHPMPDGFIASLIRCARDQKDHRQNGSSQ